MERILNENEKIRKAEEIYYRRNNRNVSILKNEEQKTKTYFGSKILLQFIILINIAIIIFAIQNKDYIFTNEFLNNLGKYNININQKVHNVLNSFQSIDNEIDRGGRN